MSNAHAKAINLAAIVDEPTVLTAVPLALIMTLAIITAVVFGGAAEHEFLNFGDNDCVTANPLVQQGLNWKTITWAFTTTRGGEWHPLTWLSHALDCALFDVNSAGPHLVNIILHVASAVTLFVLLNRMTATLWPSFVVAMIFALHPQRLESVAWVAQRKDVLATFVWMLSCWFYVAYVRSGKWTRYAASVACFALGLMAHQTLVSLPIALLLLDLWPLGRTKFFPPATLPLPQARGGSFFLLDKIPFAILAIPGAIAAIWARHITTPLPLGQRLLNALQSCTFYILKLFAPVNLAIFYPFPRQVAAWKLKGAAAVLMVITAIVAWNFRRMPWLAIGWLWYLITLVPMLGIVRIGEHALADRYTYIPHIGLLIAIVWTASEALRDKLKLGAVLASLAIAACVIGTMMQLGYWENSTAIFQHALVVTSDNDVAHNQLGLAYEKSGQGDLSYAEFTAAVHINPRNAKAHSNLGKSLSAAGRSADAVAEFQNALAIDPNLVAAYFNWGSLLARLGKPRDAAEKYRRALAIDAFYLDAHNELGVVLLQLNDLQNAVREFSKIIELNPDFADAHYNLAVALDLSGKPSEAVAEYKQTLRLQPDNEKARARLQALAGRRGM